jgi:hypothetical protein
MIVLHCKQCGWRAPPDAATKPVCPDCRACLYFISFEPGELARVNALLQRPISVEEIARED